MKTKLRRKETKSYLNKDLLNSSKSRWEEVLEGVISLDVSIQSYGAFINSVERVKVKGYECTQHCFTVYRTARNEHLMKLSSQQDASICNVASSLEGSEQNPTQCWSLKCSILFKSSTGEKNVCHNTVNLNLWQFRKSFDQCEDLTLFCFYFEHIETGKQSLMNNG